MILQLLKELNHCAKLKIVALSLNHGILSNALRENGIETIVMPEDRNTFLELYLKVLRVLKGRGADIIHSHRYKENILALLVAKSMGVKHLFTTLHGLSERSIQERNGQNRIHLKSSVDAFIVNHFFDRIVTVSQEMKKVLVKRCHFNQHKVNVIYNGIPTLSGKFLPQSLPTDGFHIGTTGRMVLVKDFDLFLEVAAAIKRQTNRVRFSILGDGPLRRALVAKAEKLDIGDCVEFLSTRADPFSYYQSLDLFLNTSLHEGIPLSILEAMALGKPVVASGVVEDIEETTCRFKATTMAIHIQKHG